MASKVKNPRLRSYGEPGLSAASVKGSYLPNFSGASATPRNASPVRAERIVTNLSRKRDTQVESIGRMPSEGFLAILGGAAPLCRREKLFHHAHVRRFSVIGKAVNKDAPVLLLENAVIEKHEQSAIVKGTNEPSKALFQRDDG